MDAGTHRPHKASRQSETRDFAMRASQRLQSPRSAPVAPLVPTEDGRNSVGCMGARWKRILAGLCVQPVEPSIEEPSCYLAWLRHLVSAIFSSFCKNEECYKIKPV
ncbi:hypothetical protein NDU88_007279 [Pleurodeles waltl]|uniref:Uncharacterized protein n=1 Tax=Pleurodeles waltl TaxID=8319 RepID=A0AAV7SS57_PLEWA|nr:hypothetical protein NDU88_007279 [Pleurodeles waltl]